MAEPKKMTLATIAGGVAEELFQYELGRVLPNMKDPNTPATARRRITLTFDFVPHEDRNGARAEFAVSVGSKSALAPVTSARSHAFFGKEGRADRRAHERRASGGL